MEPNLVCEQCGASLAEGRTCQDDFHQLLFWEAENPEFWQVHHLTVLCYHLQHPNSYSAEGLAGAKKLLVDFLEEGLTTEDVRKHERHSLDSGNREWRVRGDESSRGKYRNPINWKISVRDVVLGGKQHYPDHVRKWANSILDALRVSGNL